MFHRLKRIIIKAKDRTKDSYFNFTHAHLIRNMVTANERMLVTRKEEDKNAILIAFYPTGGFGDYIISSKLLDELLTYCNCRIDVYCENMTFGRAIYADRPCVKVIPYSTYEENRFIYDLSLKVEHFIHVLECNAARIAEISPEFMDKVESLGRSISRIRPDIGQQWFRENIHFRRCEIKGINRWTELRHENVFKISDRWTGVYLHEEFIDRLTELGLNDQTYITLNRGADSMGRSTLQTKVWPQEHYAEFVKLFKKKYPHIKIIQLGSKANTKIEGVDIYALGENFETVKWILKKSMLHLDCEGGLVHLATQLRTKCVVVFGPTPLHFYGYPQNINLVSDKCSNCMGTNPEWAFSCFKQMKEPECMYSVTADMVMKKVEDYMKKLADKVEKNVCCIKKEEIDKADFTDAYEQEKEKILNKNKVLIYDEDREKLYHYVYANILCEEKYKKIAVVGSGRDWLPFLLVKYKKQVVVFDNDFGCQRFEKNCDYMRVGKKAGIDVRLCSEWSIPYQADYFDCVINIKKWNTEECYRILNNNAKYFM